MTSSHYINYNNGKNVYYLRNNLAQNNSICISYIRQRIVEVAQIQPYNSYVLFCEYLKMK